MLGRVGNKPASIQNHALFLFTAEHYTNRFGLRNLDETMY